MKQQNSTSPALPDRGSARYRVADANARILFQMWWITFTLAALFQALSWPFSENLLSVFFAWSACIVTGVVVLRTSVLQSHPWSSLLILMFCLTQTAMPLVLMSFQYEALSAHLELPEQTYLHLMACQLVLLLVHAIYRNVPGICHSQTRMRDLLLRPLGVFTDVGFSGTFIFGLVGMFASFYIYVILRSEQGGELEQTGSVINKLLQALCPFMFAPFVLIFSREANLSPLLKQYRLLLIMIYFGAVVVVAMAFNCRSLAFMGLVIAACVWLLYVMAGQIRLELRKVIYAGLIGLIIAQTLGSDVAVAIRVARDNRANKSGLELVTETLELLTTRREEITGLKAQMSSGKDTMEAWYITDPLFSRFVMTQFQDKALAIGGRLRQTDLNYLTTSEGNMLLFGTLPNPVLNLLGFENQKKDMIVSTMGDVMQYLDSPRESKMVEGYGSGGFIGDGYALLGWAYLVVFACVAFASFYFVDSLYMRVISPIAGRHGQDTHFALVGLINAYMLSTMLNAECIVGGIVFLARQPLQMLFLYGLIFWALYFFRKLILPERIPIQLRRGERPANSRDPEQPSVPLIKSRFPLA